MMKKKTRENVFDKIDLLVDCIERTSCFLYVERHHFLFIFIVRLQ